MKKVSSLTALLVIILSLAMVSIIIAQQPGGDRNRPNRQQERQQFDPAEMMNRRVNQIMEQLKPSADEAAVLKPMIESILQTRMTQSTEMRELVNGLREAVNAKDTEKIKSSLANIKAKREANRLKMEQMGKGLAELLTLEQEASLTVAGVVNSDGMGGFIGGFGGGPGAPGQDRGNRPGGERQRQN